MGKNRNGRNKSREPKKKGKRVKIGDTKPLHPELDTQRITTSLDMSAYKCVYIHVEKLIGSERERENEKERSRGERQRN